MFMDTLHSHNISTMYKTHKRNKQNRAREYIHTVEVLKLQIVLTYLHR